MYTYKPPSLFPRNSNSLWLPTNTSNKEQEQINLLEEELEQKRLAIINAGKDLRPIGFAAKGQDLDTTDAQEYEERDSEEADEEIEEEEEDISDDGEVVLGDAELNDSDITQEWG
eukprot:Colp12_sorted_trinity150504_noHs@24180